MEKTVKVPDFSTMTAKTHTISSLHPDSFLAKVLYLGPGS
jgi:hypothetical protein